MFPLTRSSLNPVTSDLTANDQMAAVEPCDVILHRFYLGLEVTQNLSTFRIH
jgi:hypothetical protein